MKDQSHTSSDIARIQTAPKQRTDGARFFKCDDNGDVIYTICAIDLDHAKNILRRAGVEFGGYPSQPLDRAVDLEWSEYPPEKVARMICFTEDERGTISLAQARIGEWYSTEW